MSDAPSTPITLTDKAAAKILEIRAADNVPTEQALRISIKGGGCSGYTYDLNFGAPEEDDLRFDLKGVQVIVDPISLQYLDGTEIDYIDGLHGSGFKINNPNAKHTCGCGHSFST